MIKDNIARIKEDISLICRKLGRNPKDIKLVGITKAATPEMVFEAAQNGITDIGENRVQEAEKKFQDLKRSISNSNQNFSVRYHMVGHLQTNKVKSALRIFDLIQSVDSLRLAKEVSRQAEALNKIVDCLIEVNTSREATKFGVKPQDALDLIKEISMLKRIQIKGLMTIASESNDETEIRPCFRKLSLLKENISKEFKQPNVQMQYLSMGMTNDYKIALEEGSNMLRIGRAIFEDTDYTD
jgi:pyridoxal phosphate enzyme (YggS family)